MYNWKILSFLLCELLLPSSGKTTYSYVYYFINGHGILNLKFVLQMIIDIIQKAIVLHLFVRHYRSASIYSYYIFLLAWSLENQLQLSRS